jgi:hypothetical protein
MTGKIWQPCGAQTDAATFFGEILKEFELQISWQSTRAPISGMFINAGGPDMDDDGNHTSQRFFFLNIEERNWRFKTSFGVYINPGETRDRCYVFKNVFVKNLAKILVILMLIGSFCKKNLLITFSR